MSSSYYYDYSPASPDAPDSGRDDYKERYEAEQKEQGLKPAYEAANQDKAEGYIFKMMKQSHAKAEVRRDSAKRVQTLIQDIGKLLNPDKIMGDLHNEKILELALIELKKIS